MKRKIYMIALTALLLALLPCAASAEASLSAGWRDGRVAVTWSDCGSGSAVLTVYNDGWPVLVVDVDCAAGAYLVPASYTAAHGSCSVRLRTEQGCLTASVAGNAPIPTEAPTPMPTAIPEPTEAPTPSPTAAPAPLPTAKATPAPSAVPSGSSDAALAAEVVAQVNQARAAAGLGMLTVDPELTAAACVRARELPAKFSHTRPDGRSWSTVSARARGENIALGQRTADKVMAAWMSSVSHRENILRPGFRTIGVCALRVNGVVYWAQLFGN